MSQPSALAPLPGWYLNPDNAEQYRWWDGSQWTEHTVPLSEKPLTPALDPLATAAPDGSISVRLDPPQSIKVKAMFTIILTVISAVLLMVAVLEALSSYIALSQGERQIALADAPLAWGLSSFVNFFAGLVALFWFHRAYRNLQRRGYQLRFSTAQAAWSWLVPFFNLVRPKQIANDLWRAEKDGVRPEDGKQIWDLEPVNAQVHWWWALWIAGSVLMGVGSGLLPTPTDPMTAVSIGQTAIGAAKVGQMLIGIGALLEVGAALLFISFLHHVTKRQEAARRRQISCRSGEVA